MICLFLAAGMELDTTTRETWTGPVPRFRVYGDYESDWALSRRRSVTDRDFIDSRHGEPSACSDPHPHT